MNSIVILQYLIFQNSPLCFFLKESLSSAIIKLCRKNSDTTDDAYGNVLMRVLFTGIHYTNVTLKNQLSYWKCTSQLSQ